MTIAFNDIPNNIRVPLAYIEFDNSSAVQGASVQNYAALVVGQKLATGSAGVDTLYRISSKEQVETLFGSGSMLHEMFDYYFKNNRSGTEVWAIALADAGTAIKASATLEVTSVPSAGISSVMYLYLGGKRYAVPVSDADNVDAIAARIKAVIDASGEKRFVLTVVDETVTFQYVSGGEVGNSMDLRTNYDSGEFDPAGLAYTIVAFSGGVVNPDVSPVILAIAEKQFHVIISPYNDSTSRASFKVEMDDRWGPIRQNEGHVVTAKTGDFSDLTLYGSSLNDEHLTVVPRYKAPQGDHIWASAFGAVLTKFGAIDPARPFQNIELVGLLSAEIEDRFIWSERNQMLFDGISSYKVSESGAVIVERLITTYQVNGAGAEDISYLDANTMLTLSYLRFDMRNHFLLKFSRHKLGNDGTRFGPGQVVATPKLIKAEVIFKYRQWELAGLVENTDSFKENLIVERNANDPNRIDICMNPDLINQLRVIADKIAFRL